MRCYVLKCARRDWLPLWRGEEGKKWKEMGSGRRQTVANWSPREGCSNDGRRLTGEEPSEAAEESSASSATDAPVKIEIDEIDCGTCVPRTSRRTKKT